MTIHIPQIPHTLPTRTFSHCAFTQKARLLPRMLAARGADVVAYGAGDGREVWDVEREGFARIPTFVTLMDEDEWASLVGPINPQTTIGSLAVVGNAIYRQFNYSLREEFKQRLAPGDVICLPFGLAHKASYEGLEIVTNGDVALVETGIGYPDPCTSNRVYESDAWRHWIMGHEHRSGQGWDSQRLEWVIPNYYDLNDWPMTAELTDMERSTVVYFGRLEEVKGLELIPKLARERRDLVFMLCGQGDPAPWLTEPNVMYEPPIHGGMRATFLGRMRCGIFPSRFVEPFCGAAVETMLCGTPVITSDFGAFTETNIHGVTGFRCRTMENWLQALEAVSALDRFDVRYAAESRFGMDVVGVQYEQVFYELGMSILDRVSLTI